jgi:hypothetical protein
MQKQIALCHASFPSGAKEAKTGLIGRRHEELIHSCCKLTDILQEKVISESLSIGLSIEKNGREPMFPIGKIPALRLRGHWARVGDAGEEKRRSI